MKKISRVKLSLVLVFLAVLVLTLPSSYALANSIVTGANFNGNLYWMAARGIDAVNLHSAGSISYDRSFDYVFGTEIKQATYLATLALTDGSKPMIDLMGASDSFAQVGGNGSITYYIRADKTDPYAPNDVTVPLLISSYGSYDVSNTNYCRAELSSYFGTPNHLLQDLIIWGSSLAQGGHWEGRRTIQENVPLSQIFALSLFASALVGTPGANNYVDFQVIIDPIVQIDPDWMVDYNGQMVPGAQLYSLSMSPGFTAAVPLPGSLILLGSGLLSLVGWRRFKKD